MNSLLTVPSYSPENCEQDTDCYDMEERNYDSPQNQRSLLGKLKRHAAETLGGIVAVGLPVYATLEMGIVGMSNYASMETRASAVAIGALGLTSVYSAGRRWVQRKWGINEKSSGAEKRLTDLTYSGLFNSIVNPAFYSLAMLASHQEISPLVVGRDAFIAGILGAAAGSAVGIGMDVYRDLLGNQRSTRVPEKIRRLPRRTKKLLAAAITAGSLTLSSFLYSDMPDSANYENEPGWVYRAVEQKYALDLRSSPADYQHSLENHLSATALPSRHL